MVLCVLLIVQREKERGGKGRGMLFDLAAVVMVVVAVMAVMAAVTY